METVRIMSPHFCAGGVEGSSPAEAKKQVGGNHYLKAIQPWDIIQAWDLDYWRGNVVKYVLRAPHKNGVEDLKKAIHYLEYLIQFPELMVLK